MCPKKQMNKIEEQFVDSDSDSDVSMSDGSEESTEEDEPAAEDKEETIEEEEEEEEDEVIKAIRTASDAKRNHPPIIQCDDFITDISFHPHEDLLAVASIVGDVILYKYTNEENTIVNTFEVHSKACRDIEFSNDGKVLFSAGKDKTVMLTDVETGKIVNYIDDAHDVPIYRLLVMDENMFATGDDDGCIKLWDLRVKKNSQVYKTKKNEDYISDMATNEAQTFLLCSSGDGSLTTIDLRNRKVHMQSEEYEEELTCLGLFRTESKLLAGSSKGRLLLYNWNEFGLHSDIFPGPKAAINDMIPITENIVVTACDDGILRATHLFPNRHLGVVGQHDLSVEHVDICSTGQFIASSSYNNDIKFWNIKYFEDLEKISQKHKKHETKKELLNNLPSSKRQNVTDFFSGLL